MLLREQLQNIWHGYPLIRNEMLSCSIEVCCPGGPTIALKFHSLLTLKTPSFLRPCISALNLVGSDFAVVPAAVTSKGVS